MADSHSTVRRTFKYRLYPTAVQAIALDEHLSECCRLYNAALQERRDAWRMRQERVGFLAQDRQLKDIRAGGDVGIASFGVARDVLRRVERAYAGFFRRVRANRGKAGYPRFKSRDRYDSFTFPEYGDGVGLQGSGRLRLYGIGAIKVRLHRPVVGTIKTATVRREAGKWFVCLCVVETSDLLPPSVHAVGVDVGLTHFATLSDGSTIENPRHGRKAERRLRLAQRRIARRASRSRRRRKAVVQLQAAQMHVRQQRADFQHKATTAIVARYGLIAVENLNVKGLAAGRLARSIHDAAWSAFIDRLTYKAESAGRVLVKVDPRGTSQTCECGASVPKTLGQRWHYCPSCGLSLPRDHVSARIILGRGLRLQTPSVARVALV